MKGYIKEIFTSVQGEGIRVGQRQIFIRFFGCNLSCKYCDTPETQRMKGHLICGGQEFENPVDIGFVVDQIKEPKVAITGGEPLLQIGFLKGLCQALKAEAKDIYLDTNGTLPDGLEQVIDYLDIVALDFKIPSATGGQQFWSEHERSLRISRIKEVFVKMVIDENLKNEELDKTCEIIKGVDQSIPLVLQPVFSHDIPNILDIQHRASAQLKDVRIIPQVHKYLKLK